MRSSRLGSQLNQDECTWRNTQFFDIVKTTARESHVRLMSMAQSGFSAA